MKTTIRVTAAALLIIGVAALVISSRTHARSEALVALKDGVAGSLGYPSGRLFLSNETEAYAAKTAGNVIAVFVIKSGDETFAPVAVAIGKKGALLSAELDAFCQDRIANGSRMMRRLDFGRGIYGYSGIGVLGPGGSEEKTVVTWPERGIDLQVKLMMPGEPLPVREDLLVYRGLVTGDRPGLEDRMLRIMREVIRYAEKAGL